MNNSSLDAVRKIDGSMLDGANYFESLMRAALNAGILSAEAAGRIQYELLELVAMKTEQFSGGYSSSIPVDAAKELANSVVYTIGLTLKTYPTPELALASLEDEKLSELYAEGKERLDEVLSSISKLYAICVRTLPKTENTTMNDTVQKGIRGFLKRYNPEYQAQETIITADYPTAVPMPSLTGAEFIYEYLKRIYIENRFIMRFDSGELSLLLSSYNEKSNYSELVFNIMTELLACSLANELTGKNPLHALPCHPGLIDSAFAGKSRDEIQTLLLSSLDRVTELLGISSRELCDYLRKTTELIASRVYAALTIGHPSHAFICAHRREKTPEMVISFAGKMDDDSYRLLLDELGACESFDEKRTLLFEKVKSLGDFEDLLRDIFDLTAEETAVLLSKLTPYELAALKKRHSGEDDIDSDELPEGEMRLRRGIRIYLDGQTAEYLALFKKLTGIIETSDLPQN